MVDQEGTQTMKVKHNQVWIKTVHNQYSKRLPDVTITHMDIHDHIVWLRHSPYDPSDTNWPEVPVDFLETHYKLATKEELIKLRLKGLV